MHPFRYYLRVRYAECDAQKVVFNARYGEYVDLAVTEFSRAAGLLAEGNVFDEFDYQVVKQTTEWKASARFDNVLELSVSTKHVGNTSFTLFVEIRIAGDPKVITTIESVYVNVDPHTLAKTHQPTHSRSVNARRTRCRHRSCRHEIAKLIPKHLKKNGE